VVAAVIDAPVGDVAVAPVNGNFTGLATGERVTILASDGWNGIDRTGTTGEIVQIWRSARFFPYHVRHDSDGVTRLYSGAALRRIA